MDWKALREYEEQQRLERLARMREITERKNQASMQVQAILVAREEERRIAELHQVNLQVNLTPSEQQDKNETRNATLDLLSEQLRSTDRKRTEEQQIILKAIEEKRKATQSGSPIEHSFFEAWCDAYPDIKLERQYSIGRFRVDFAHVATRVVIELDGHHYHSSRKDRTKDAQRERLIQMQGWHVVRYTGSEVHTDVRSCVMQVAEIISQRQGR